jgi:membrane protein YqaA with SNARE-associated domain
MSDQTEAAAVPWYRKPMQWVRWLYDWTLSWAETPYGTPALFLLAFSEASFFPVPPDVLLIALALSKRARSFYYAAVCTAGSITGALLGWYIGFGLWQGLGVHPDCPQFGGGAWFFDHIPNFTCPVFGKVQELYASNAWLALFTAAFTFIPYKVFTIAAGVFSISLTTLVAASLMGRGARFFLVGTLIFFVGPPVKGFIEKRFDLMVLVFTVLLIGGFVLVKYLM